MGNKKSSEKLSNIIQEIESAVKEKEQRGSGVVHDKIDEESQDEPSQSEGNKDVITFIITIIEDNRSTFPGRQATFPGRQATSPPRHGHQGYRGEYEASPAGNGTSHRNN